ncbi:MAG: Lrp/AsnC family transcriptional regulator [Faecalibacterium sp.]|jgi:Lrp/AsnC family leucine-responsive transcriptional regulator|nr:Lrp/AsnC family transcriptional regulator [Faecalibacterium sp.]
MDELDQKILGLLVKNARMPVKDIAEQVALTSPAVSSRIRKMERSGVIGGYTVMLHRPNGQAAIDALISVSAAPSVRPELMQLLQGRKEVLQCYHVTGAHSFLVKVSCSDMSALEHLIMAFQKLGETSTQIILSTPVDRSGLDMILEDQEVSL